VFEMNNGCICCTVRGDLIRGLHGLLSKEHAFDAIVVETTGLADPGPVVQTFFVDHFLQQRTVVDSVTTVVDAVHILRQLDDSREAVEQIAFADQIVLNKTELVASQDLSDIESRLRRLNPLASIHRTQRANVELEKVLGRGGFDIERIVDLEPDFLEPRHGEPGHVHDEHCGHAGHVHEHHDHEHDSGIHSVALKSSVPMDAGKIDAWLNTLVATKGADILRAKGILDVAGEDRRLVFQAVHMLLEGDFQRVWRSNETRCSRLVFIGRNLDEHALKAAFDGCVAGK
jgi:G3E family GTPase